MAEEQIEQKLVELLDTIYSAAPKDHNRRDFESEFQSRVKASLNVKDMKSFVSKLLRKLGIKIGEIYTKTNQKVFDFDNDKGQYLQKLRDELEYILILAKIRREERREEAKKKKQKKIKDDEQVEVLEGDIPFEELVEDEKKIPF